MTTALFEEDWMTLRARQLAEGFAEVYRQTHPEEPAQEERAPSAEEIEAAAVAAFGAAIYGTPPPPTAPPKEDPS
jgi:hypothetical protein